MPHYKKTLSVIVGVLIASIIFTLFEYIGTLMYPFPKDMNMESESAMKDYIAALPALALIIILVGYAVGSFIAGLVIGKIAKSPLKKLPLIAGTILTIGAIANLYMIPSPIWFMIINIILYIPFTILGNSVTTKNILL